MRLYRLLLWLYPAGFRAEYGEEMRAVFAEKRCAASGAVPLLALWLEAFSDVVRHAVPLHLEILRQDLRYALRSLARAPGFALTVVGVSALGIGANTAVFTVTDLVLVRPLPFHEPERLVRVWQHPPGYARMEVSPPNYRDWRSMATSFEAMAAYTRRSANLSGEEAPARVQGAAVTAELLPMLGVPPAHGRVFTEEDEADGAPATVVLSHRLWQRAFAGDPRVIGSDVVLDDVPHTVLGVMPPEFAFPDRRVELWAAIRFGPEDYEDRSNNELEVVARLKPDVSLAQARDEMRSVMARLEAAHPVENERTSATVNRLGDEVPRQARLLLGALMGASLCVLLIACTNLANLLLARAMVRRQELAVRRSLGAGRERLIRQLLTESVGLAALGGVLGVLLAHAALPLLARLVPDSIPVSGAPSLDARVLLFALGLTALTGVGFGALPAARAGRSALATGLRQDARGGGGRSGRLRGGLVIVEVTASVALLVAAGLLIRSLDQVQSRDPGFRAEGVLTLRTWLGGERYVPVAERAAFYSRVLEDVRALPGVSGAAYTSYLPFVMGGGIWPVEMEGGPRNRAESQTASLRFVTPGYFETLGIPIVDGRDVAESDTQDRPFVAVVSRSFVERHFPGQDPLGRTFKFAFFERTVAGVVGDVRVRGLERASEPQVYLPYQQVPDGGLWGYVPKDLAVRASGDPMQLVPAIRDIIRRTDAGQPVSDVRLLEEIVAADSAPRREQLRILGAFAALAILLAALGIHGLLSFTVSHRAREMGVRIALGARPRSLLAMVLREGLVLGVAGAACGVLLGYAAARVMHALLAGVRPADALTFGAAVGLSLGVTVVGSLLPALRAARADPNAVMREG